jgi:hypothetical protein
MTDEKDTPSPDPESVQVKLNFRILGRMPSVYAHHMFVQPQANEVLLSFFEVVPPPVFDASQDRIKFLQETGVMADCIARITVARDSFPSFVEAMQTALNQLTSEGQEPTIENADDTRNNQKS